MFLSLALVIKIMCDKTSPNSLARYCNHLFMGHCGVCLSIKAWQEGAQLASAKLSHASVEKQGVWGAADQCWAPVRVIVIYISSSI